MAMICQTVHSNGICDKTQHTNLRTGRPTTVKSHAPTSSTYTPACLNKSTPTRHAQYQ